MTSNYQVVNVVVNVVFKVVVNVVFNFVFNLGGENNAFQKNVERNSVFVYDDCTLFLYHHRN